jgi:hypothetical protein
MIMALGSLLESLFTDHDGNNENRARVTNFEIETTASNGWSSVRARVVTYMLFALSDLRNIGIKMFEPD